MSFLSRWHGTPSHTVTTGPGHSESAGFRRNKKKGLKRFLEGVPSSNDSSRCRGRDCTSTLKYRNFGTKLSLPASYRSTVPIMLIPSLEVRRVPLFFCLFREQSTAAPSGPSSTLNQS
eukprot:762824-Hanusia_phi.AAC.2